MQRKEFFIGVDVSKETLDVAIAGTKNHIRIANSTVGFRQLQTWFKAQCIELSACWFVFEFTGGYEFKLVQFCTAKEIAFTRFAGLEIKKSLGIQRGKNDKIDSKRIAEYGYEKREKLKPHAAESAVIIRIKQLLTQRTGFIKDRKAHEHRVKELLAMMNFNKADPMISNYILAAEFARKMTAKTDELIMREVNENDEIKLTFQLLTSIPGIGPINALMTIAYTENFKRFADGRKFGSYCGVVPFDHSSGKSIRGKSRINHMANKEIKATLSMAARATIVHDHEMKLYYQRRKEMGKHPMSIINEIRFKLILRMFAVVNKQQLYVDKYKNAA
jgi:transposase